MNIQLRVYLVIFLLLIAGEFASAHETASGDHVRVTWLAPDAFSRSSEEIIGLHFEVAPGWHVYWRNAGDSGAAPRFDFSNNNADLGSILWPFPARLPVAHLTNFGYEGNTAYLFSLAPVKGAQQVNLDVDLEWLVCKIDCIPGFGRMSLQRPIEDKARWRSELKQRRDLFLERVPKPSDESPWQAVNVRSTASDQLRLRLEYIGDYAGRSAEPPQVFPLQGDLFVAKAPKVEESGDVVTYAFGRVPGADLDKHANFIISDGERAWKLHEVPISVRSPAPEVTVNQPLWILLLGAMLGGFILNLMPCVFPVLSIKLMSLINTPAEKRLREALAYTAGVLSTFATLGALLLALRSGGAAIGWGFQLQSPGVLLALIVLFWLMALSFSGVFEFGHRLTTLASTARGGAFVTGMLAVFVATPCTGPFMGAALGAAAVLPAYLAIAIFLGLGLGLAAPFILISLSPKLLQRFPKPGAWMETLRQLLAFPLYATVIWLLWVLAQILGADAWLLGTCLLLAIVFSLWLVQKTQRFKPAIGFGLSCLIAMSTYYASLTIEPEKSTKEVSGAWQHFSHDKLVAARRDNRAVFIDYTAAWCITCQVNKKLVLDTEETIDLFHANNVLLLRADWTQYDPEITRSLAQLERNSVPVYAWYAPGKDVELLPQLLSVSAIQALFSANSSSLSTVEATP